MTTIKILIAVSFAISTTLATAEEALPTRSDPMVIISQAVNDICIEAQTSGTSQHAKLNAEITAKLNELVRKLADADGTLAASYDGEHHSGVLKEQVLDAIKEANSCRTHVFDSLVERLMPKSTTPPPSTSNIKVGKQSPQDAYLIATHPTKVVVRDISLSNFIEDNDTNYITVHLENKSEIPAKSTTTEILVEKRGTPLPKSEVLKVRQSKYYFSAGASAITIPAYSVSEFPIISVQDLIKFLNINDDNYCLFDLSSNPINLMEQVTAFNHLQFDLGTDQSASQPMTRQKGIRIKIKYNTIFEETVTNYSLIYAHFTERYSKGWVFHPSTKKMAHIKCIDY